MTLLYMLTMKTDKKHIPVLHCCHNKSVSQEYIWQFSYNMFQSITNMNYHEGHFSETWDYTWKSICSLFTVQSLTTAESLKHALFYCLDNSFQLNYSFQFNCSYFLPITAFSFDFPTWSPYKMLAANSYSLDLYS